MSKETIDRFYTAFAARDGEAMAACYAPGAHFEDPVFPALDGEGAGNMWRMLTERADDLVIEHSDVKSDGKSGQAHWEAHYTFSATGRKVHNKIDARFEFDDDGLITRHVDTFDFWAWSRQALGVPGVLLGWTGFLQRKVQGQAGAQLKKFAAKRAGR